MKLIQFLVFLLLLGSCSSGKNTQITTVTNTSGIVNYQIQLDLKEEAAGMEEVFGNAAIATFNDQYLHFKKNNDSPSKDFQIVDLSSGEETNYMTVKDKKFALKTPKESLPEIGPFAYYPNKQKTIAGYRCKEARAKMGDGEMIVYYTKDIGVNFCPYADLKGFALEYTLNMHYGQVKYTADKVNLQAINEELVRPPAGYTLVTAKELEEELMGKVPVMADGYKTSNFTKLDMDGKDFTLANYQGKVVVINFWFSKCKPCQLEMPDLNQLQASNVNKNVEFLAVTFDKKETVNQFLKNNRFDFKIIPDAHDVIKQYDIFAYPTTLILDQSGKIVNSKMGGSGNIQQELQEMIDQALN